MHLVIAVNHSWDHVGGSERVVQQISEAMVSNYGYRVTVVSRSRTSDDTHNGVEYVRCARNPEDFIKQLRRLTPSHTLVYSDCFTYWSVLLKELENVPGTKSIALVGMNHMLGRSGDMRMFLDKKDQIRTITHSDNYQDYKICTDKGITPTVIPNGVDLEEFDKAEYCFRDRYQIGTGNLIVCVSNFFPGKGQNHLIPPLRQLHEKGVDFTAVFISNNVNFPFARILSSVVEKSLATAKFKNRFFTSLARKYVVAAISEADVFAFPSQKEVAPLVVLEAMACRTPWVAMPVGNVPQLDGGKIVPSRCRDKDGFAKYDSESYKWFAKHLEDILTDEKLKKKLGDDGRYMIESTYNWEAISEQYDRVFKS